MTKRRLYPDTCLELLEGVPVGRVIVSTWALPLVSPVHFVLDDESVVFWALENTRLAASVTHRNFVVFQADSYDPIERSGWSVLGVGRATRLDVANEHHPRPQRLPEPWAVDDDAQHLVRLDLYEVSGTWIG